MCGHWIELDDDNGNLYEYCKKFHIKNPNCRCCVFNKNDKKAV
jgi:hypothetical protein